MYITLCMEPFLKVITYKLKFYVRVVIFGTFPTDLSKTFDGISHVLLVAKLNADGFTLPITLEIRNKIPKLTSRIARGITGCSPPTK